MVYFVGISIEYDIYSTTTDIYCIYVYNENYHSVPNSLKVCQHFASENEILHLLFELTISLEP